MKQMIVNYLAIIAPILAFVLPLPLLAADLEITEIMYDPEGSDASYEWLEVHNVSGSSLNLEEWAFYENDTAHSLTVVSGGSQLATGGRAIIARSPDDFQTRHSISALLADSSFSLVNGGESLALETPAGDMVGEVTYDPSIGAAGDGNSLQWTGSKWVAAAPTPGAVNAGGGSVNTQNDNSDNTGSSGSSMPGASMDPRASYTESEASNLSISAGGNINAWVGLPVELGGEVKGAGSDEVEASWLVGNGDEQPGTSTSYTYQYPGEYVATFSVTTDEETLTDQLIVNVLAPKLALESTVGADGYVKIHNQTPRRFDLSGWQLASGREDFTLPEHSTALARGALIVPNRVSGFSTATVSLYRPDGTLATSTQASNYSAPQTYPASVAQANTSSRDSSAADNTVLSTTETSQTPTSSATTSSSSAGLVLGTSTAAAASAGQLSVFAQWGGLLLALLLAAIGTVILMRRVSKPADKPEVQAAKFDINEINE